MFFLRVYRNRILPLLHPMEERAGERRAPYSLTVRMPLSLLSPLPRRGERKKKSQVRKSSRRASKRGSDPLNRRERSAAEPQPIEKGEDYHGGHGGHGRVVLESLIGRCSTFFIALPLPNPIRWILRALRGLRGHGPSSLVVAASLWELRGQKSSQPERKTKDCSCRERRGAKTLRSRTLYQRLI